MPPYVAQMFVSPSPDALQLGAPMQALLSNIRTEELRPILAKHGLTEIKADHWYPMQIFLDVFRDIVDRQSGVTLDLIAIGIRGVETSAPFPPEIDTLEKGLAMMDYVSRHVNVKNVPPEFGYPVTKIEEGHLHLTNNTPIPDDSIYGYIWGITNRLKKADDVFFIIALPKTSPEQPTTFEILWGDEAFVSAKQHAR
ncbi:MAG: hypothetical protein MUF87_07665 [Anaerolineae bacterium]|jgi:hypothetical protein|nr:hypothetical protein [Anaerolineae bacterium]